MKKTVEIGSTYTIYEYAEDEFKRLLGIDDPRRILTVESPVGKRIVRVRMMP